VEPPSTTYLRVRAGPPEVWRAEDGREVTFDPASGALERAGQPPVAGRTTWPDLGSIAMCLGDPLIDPLPTDPQAFRRLEWSDRPRWVLELSGVNRCTLAGTLVLDATANRVDPTALTVDGLPWARGGRQQARRTLAAGLRADAVAAWPDLDEPARLRVLDLLARDPEPEAAAVLNRLLPIAGELRPDVEAALLRRDPIGPDPPP